MPLCKVCGAIDDLLFYKSINVYCKEHWKERVRKNRVKNIEHYRSFDKMRASIPHRVSMRKEYSKTEQGRIAHLRAKKAWAARNPERIAATRAVQYAVHIGKIKKLPCFICGEQEVEGHHPDYSQPLQVVWLCEYHHKELHWHMEDRKAA